MTEVVALRRSAVAFASADARRQRLRRTVSCPDSLRPTGCLAGFVAVRILPGHPHSPGVRRMPGAPRRGLHD